MPKVKTKKMLAKRVRISAGGKLLFTRPGRSHLLSSKTRKQKRRLRRPGCMCSGDARRMKGIVPHH